MEGVTQIEPGLGKEATAEADPECQRLGTCQPVAVQRHFPSAQIGGKI